LDQIGFSWEPFNASWDEFFAALVDYKKAHGDCDVSAKWLQNPALGRWVSTQRKDKKNRRISEDRARRLEEIGFVWELLETSWDDSFAALVNYKNIHANCNVPARWQENPRLGSWVSDQRKSKRNHQLSKERMRRLDDIRFAWAPIATNCQAMFAAFLDYKKKFGNCNVPQRWASETGLELGAWVGTQRLLKKRGELSPERIRKLDEVGFVWETLNSKWDRMFAELAAHKQKYGDCNVPLKWPDNPKLGTWVGGQRKSRVERRLSEVRIRRLDGLGFVWEIGTTAWESMFAELVAYKKSHGDCNVPNAWPENRKLGHWVLTQRASRRKRELSKERMRRLNTIGLVWDPLDAEWEAMFVALEAFKKAHGDCQVPAEWPENRRLGMWVGTQRRRRKKGKLSKERISNLNRIGFVWDKLDAAWEQRFREIVEYKRTHAHCNVAMGWPENPQLAIWVARQRQFRRKRRLSGARIERLSNLGFVWNVGQAKWEEMFSSLSAFKHSHGHCNVAQKWSQNVKLGGWVSTQRLRKKEGKLSTQRSHRLNEIGFQW
jgi:hypothetical protein